ncbi:SubName: Full=Uncharacterized protein {ECO:0000313/EMBL:CCA75417.1} [Serendipita indica DSM 11827]|uniref:F-box domain-containing protein n=1 Tax=Serendipita indica (strain DSM 11827) TaxID=1109443 RepID=G4TVS4_SERID|nr:SubName: Full=Uncharacterized protein {ECO:0000313/EMBL:CCA75417.1} [Serendipita indica DSM 11827]CCA75417.1 hypothetical protein PIIN_09400 [Serendipita indica DSM 11827]
MEHVNVSLDAPTEIQHKASQMNGCREEIEDLLIRLKAAESRWNSLRDDVAPYIQKADQKAAVATRSVKVSLNRLPDELLYDIFRRLRFHWNSNLGPLLLVNKRIHHFVMKTPSLWTRIGFHADFDLLYTRFPKQSYIEACIERSHGVGLDIEINVEVGTKEDFLKQAAVGAVLSLVDEPHNADIFSIFDNVDMDLNCSKYEEKCKELVQVIDMIIGINGCNMPLWRSLHLVLPYDYILHISVLERFIGYTPNLRELHLENTWLLDDDDDSQYIWEQVLPELSDLRSFGSDHCLPWAFSTLNPAMLKELNFSPKIPSNFDKLSLYQALQHLVIAWGGIDVPNDSTIFLPNLCTLSITGGFEYVIARLRLPTLNKFSVRSFKTCLSRSLPIAMAVEWYFTGNSDEADIEGGALQLLQGILSGLRGTKTVFLSGFTKEVLLNAIRPFKQSSSFSEELQMIELRQHPNAHGPPLLELGRSDLAD